MLRQAVPMAGAVRRGSGGSKGFAPVKPAPDWSVVVHRSEAGWQIAARWYGYDDDPPGDVPGPREVLIRPDDDIRPEILHRGVTTGVMRRLERHLGDMAREFASKRLRDADRQYEREVAEALAELPSGPQAAKDEYYEALLHVFDMFSETYREPINALAQLMGVPRGTLNNRLVTARRLRNRKSAARNAG